MLLISSIISNANVKTIAKKVAELNIKGSISGTNGTYTYSENFIKTTTNAALNFVMDNNSGNLGAFFVAINSDKSMKMFNSHVASICQYKRAEIVLKAIKTTSQKNNIPVIIMFYDEETPEKLYAELAKVVELDILYKFNYGYGVETSKIKPILGAEHFKTVYAFAPIEKNKPTSWEGTPSSEQLGNVIPINLKDKVGSKCKSYI